MIEYCEYHEKPISKITEKEIAECPVPGYGTDCLRCVYLGEIERWPKEDEE